MTGLDHLRSLLFAPADDERKLRRALESDADGVIADLEDGVEAGRKEEARVLAARLLREMETSAARLVRINNEEPRDLELLAGLDVDAIVLPKATPAAVAGLGPCGPPIIALVETAAGLRSAFETASAPRVAALMLGSVDLAAELRLSPRADGLELLAARSQLVVDSAAAGLRAPFDGVWVHVKDLDGLAREVSLARSIGFGGKACIHPAQLAAVVSGFGAEEHEIAWAKATVAAYESALAAGRGVAVVDGEMIDEPVGRRARQILDREERRG